MSRRGRIASATWKVRWSLQHRGVLGTFRSLVAAVRRRLRGAEAAIVHPFDAEHGTDTGGLIPGGALGAGGANDPHINGYAGVPPSRFRAAVDLWQSTLAGEPIELFSLVDLGCGKGRAVLLGSQRPFRESVGVELDPELAATAARNVERWLESGKAICPVRVQEGDATAFVYPAGPTFLFLYNPFAAPVMRAVLEQMQARARAGEDRMDLVYLNEPEACPLCVDSRLQLLWRGTLPLSAEDAAADPVASPDDVTSLYRWVG